MRNSRCGVSVKEARKEWHPPKEVLNSANIEGRNRRWLVQLPNSIGLHGARGLKVQILKGTKEHQVQSSFVGQSSYLLGQEVKALKCKTFIQALGGNNLCLNSDSIL